MFGIIPLENIPICNLSSVFPQRFQKREIYKIFLAFSTSASRTLYHAILLYWDCNEYLTMLFGLIASEGDSSRDVTQSVDNTLLSKLPSNILGTYVNRRTSWASKDSTIIVFCYGCSVVAVGRTGNRHRSADLVLQRRGRYRENRALIDRRQPTPRLGSRGGNEAEVYSP